MALTEERKKMLIDVALAGETDADREKDSNARFRAAVLRTTHGLAVMPTQEEWLFLREVFRSDAGEDMEVQSYPAAGAPAGYEGLAGVLQDALEQAAFGKGKERHANDKPFDEQPIAEISRMVGLGFPLGQAAKKGQEAVGMASRGQREAARNELLGAIVYLSAAVMLLDEQG